jgi:GTP cyclohydrolase II
MTAKKRASVIVPVPTDNTSVNTRFITFSGLTDNKEHIAVIYGEPENQQSPLVRIHSECLTGDVFGSLRCDCGEQLHEAQRRMTQEGGVILYLRQEGRGIGLYNKIDAYVLQDKGIDTYEANSMLGFDHDLRDFTPAIEMLKALNISSIRLLTNNPLKTKELTEAGIAVTECINTGAYVNKFNTNYLKAKVEQKQHKIKIQKTD